jgi:hypothetical protein
MARNTTWNGTPDEALALLQALRTHCACHIERGRTLASCPGHAMLARDQRAVDGLLFMRRMAAHLLAEEFDVAVESKLDPEPQPTSQPAGQASVAA